MHRILVEKDHGKPVIVWCLKLLKNMTIVNGDSRGRVQVRLPCMHVPRQLMVTGVECRVWHAQADSGAPRRRCAGSCGQR